MRRKIATSLPIPKIGARMSYSSSFFDDEEIADPRGQRKAALRRALPTSKGSLHNLDTSVM